MMDPWTVVVAGLVVIPLAGLIAIVADLLDCYKDLVFVKAYFPPPSVEHEQTKHALWSQGSRAFTLIVIMVMAVMEFFDVLTGDGIATLIYFIAVAKVLDSWRARRVRKRMIALIPQTQETPAAAPKGSDGGHG